jgi:hypothetical protein
MVTSSAINQDKAKSADVSSVHKTDASSVSDHFAILTSTSDVSSRTSTIEADYIVNVSALSSYVTITNSNNSDISLSSSITAVDTRISDIYVDYSTSEVISGAYPTTDLSSVVSAVDTRTSDIEKNYVTSSNILSTYLRITSDILGSDIEDVSSRVTTLESNYVTSSSLSTTYARTTDSSTSDTNLASMATAVSNRTSDIQRDYRTSSVISSTYASSNDISSTYVIPNASNTSDTAILTMVSDVDVRVTALEAGFITSSTASSGFAGTTEISNMNTMIASVSDLYASYSSDAALVSTINTGSLKTATASDTINVYIASDQLIVTSDRFGASQITMSALEVNSGSSLVGKIGLKDWVNRWDMEVWNSDRYYGPDFLYSLDGTNAKLTSGDDGDGVFLAANGSVILKLDGMFSSLPYRLATSDNIIISIQTNNTGSFNGNSFVVPVNGHTPTVYLVDHNPPFSETQLGTVAHGSLVNDQIVEFSYVYTSSITSSPYIKISQSSSAGSAVIRAVRFESYRNPSDIVASYFDTYGIATLENGKALVSDSSFSNLGPSSRICLSYYGEPVNPGTLYIDSMVDTLTFRIGSTNQSDSSRVAWFTMDFHNSFDYNNDIYN